MMDAFDPHSTTPARPVVAALDLGEAARSRLAPGLNVRQFLDRLIADGLASDALPVIAQALPVQFQVAWCCECVRQGLDGAGPALDAERAAVMLAEQCLRDPSDENRQVCLELAGRGGYATAGAWLATAAAWADGNLTTPEHATQVPAPARAVASAVVAALKLAAVRGGGDARARLTGYASRALRLFGPRAAGATP